MCTKVLVWPVLLRWEERHIAHSEVKCERNAIRHDFKAWLTLAKSKTQEVSVPRASSNRGGRTVSRLLLPIVSYPTNCALTL
eukprot:411108-Amphidinium_carterae.1